MHYDYGMKLIKIFKLLLNVVFLIFTIYFMFKLATYLAPFILAFFISILLEPFIGFLVNRLKISRKASSAFVIVVFIGGVGTAIGLIINKFIKEFVDLSKKLPEDFTQIYENINLILERASRIYFELPEEIAINIEVFISDLSDSLLEVLNSFVKGVFNKAGSLPQILIFTIILVLATYFFSVDKEKIFEYIHNQTPFLWWKKIISIKDDLFSALIGYVKAQCIMMGITFIELLIGFSFIGVKYVLTLSLVISLMDALPLLGTGGILIPWAIYSILTQEVRRGLYLIILYLVVLLVRQIIEPKILSDQIGIHPLWTLVSIYIGLQFIGVLGVILGPIIIIVLKNILSEFFKEGIQETFLKIKKKYL